jgi:hypothetical protein
VHLNVQRHCSPVTKNHNHASWKAYLCLPAFICFYSCKNKKPAYGKPASNPSEITGSFLSFWQYKEDKVKLYEEFVALDEERRPVRKDTFLRRLTTGLYLPLRLQTTDSTGCYQLHPLKEGTDPEIQETIKAWANEEYTWYKVEGIEVPCSRSSIWREKSTTGNLLKEKPWC